VGKEPEAGGKDAELEKLTVYVTRAGSMAPFSFGVMQKRSVAALPEGAQLGPQCGS
jgi:hypothetical protein